MPINGVNIPPVWSLPTLSRNIQQIFLFCSHCRYNTRGKPYKKYGIVLPTGGSWGEKKIENDMMVILCSATHKLITWWRREMKTFSALLHYWPFVGIMLMTGGSPKVESVMWSFDDFYLSLNKLLNIHLSCRWFVTSWCSSVVLVTGYQ